jgi:tRNA dimethylallyltransferase
MKPKVLVILGPTATGKSDLAVKIALKHKGEVISADSRQVYKGLDIGTGKITKEEMQGIHHWLLDVVSPQKTFSVADYKKLAEEKIKTILKRSKLPIIVGGTGFYIQSIVDDLILPEVPADDTLRKELSIKSPEELLLVLKSLDSERLKTIDTKNKVRLIRAIEIAKTLGKVPAVKKAEPKYVFLQIGLTLSPEELKAKIKKRLISRVKKGMIEEAEKLHKKGLSFERMRELGLEYRYLADLIEKRISKKEIMEKLETAIYQYSKRQMTWFKRDKRVKWFKPNEHKSIDFLVYKFLKNE